MKFSKIKFSKEASDALDKMKGRIGLNWNILCRIGFCISLNDSVDVNPFDYKSNGSVEIDKKILLGHEEDLYIALLIQRCIENSIPEDLYLDYFRAHMNRGVLLLSKRISNIKDIARLLPS